jgi:hypothetical protein
MVIVGGGYAFNRFRFLGDAAQVRAREQGKKKAPLP